MQLVLYLLVQRTFDLKFKGRLDRIDFHRQRRFRGSLDNLYLGDIDIDRQNALDAALHLHIGGI